MDPNDKILDNPNLIFERDVSFRTYHKKHARSYNEPTPFDRPSIAYNQDAFPTFKPILMP